MCKEDFKNISSVQNYGRRTAWKKVTQPILILGHSFINYLVLLLPLRILSKNKTGIKTKMVTKYVHNSGAAKTSPTIFSQPISRRNPETTIKSPTMPGNVAHFTSGEMPCGVSSRFSVFCEGDIELRYVFIIFVGVMWPNR